MGRGHCRGRGWVEDTQEPADLGSGFGLSLTPCGFGQLTQPLWKNDCRALWSGSRGLFPTHL